jgi:hypothetical protein
MSIFTTKITAEIDFPVNKTKAQYDSVIRDCKDIFLKKTHDYGPSWSILRMPSLTDQIYIKAERTRSIQEKQVNKVGESMESEFIGIINYCVIALMLLDILEQNQGQLPADIGEPGKLEALYDSKVLAAYTTMEKKNHDYGEAWRNMRIMSFTDLILMKILRLKQIEDNQGKTLISEGPDANYIDILNYAVFALIKLTKES